MRKNLFITLLILALAPCSVYSQELVDSPADLEQVFNETFYEAPFMPLPEVEVKSGNQTRPVRGTPVFKKVRIKVTNYLREKDYKKTQELIQKQKQQMEEQEAEDEAILGKDLNINFKETKKEKNVSAKKRDNNEKIEESSEHQEKTLELEGGVKEQVTSNNVLLDADNIDYDDENHNITATGKPILKFPQQNVILKADKMIYNKDSNILKAYGNVELVRDGSTMYGDYMQVNMNEESAFMDNMNTKQSFMTVTARKSEMEGDKIILHDGKIESKESYILNLQTKMIGGNNFNNMIINDEDRSSIADDVGDTSIHVKAKEIFVNAKKNNDVITLKKAQIRYGDYDLFTIPSITAHTNKKREFFEANYPEFGSRGKLGMYLGPGFVFDTPLQDGSTVKILPILNNKSGIGFGGLLKYRSATNYTDLGYGSSADIFMMKGKQYFDDKLYMQYGVNSYMDEWFFGPRMPKYMAELVYKDRTIVPSTIHDGLDLTFSHRFGIGYMQNNDANRHGENIPPADIGTLRTRYMAEVSQSLFKYHDKEHLRYLDLAFVMQGSAALYGTGDTQFVGRLGPRVHTQYKYWMQDIGFFATAYQDGTPMQMYDMYRYGHASVYLREALRVHKYVTLAWSGTLTLTGDSPNGEMFQENSFIIALGPDDFKINFGYDWVRRQTYFAFVIAMDTKGSSLEFDKMVIKNPDRLARSDKEEPQLKVFDEENQTSKANSAKKMMYAEVIELEDPDKESI